MGRKINILVCSPYYPPHVGGLENHAEEFAIQATQHGHSVTIWTANIPMQASCDEVQHGVRVIRYDAAELLGGFPIPAIWTMSFWRQYKEIKKMHHDLVISRTRFFLSSVLARAFAIRNHLPHIHIEHGSDYVHLHSSVATACAYLYDKTFGVYVLKHSDAVVANSQATKIFVQEFTNGAVVPTVIYRGVDKEHILSQAPNILAKDAAQGKVILCYLGRLIDGKGVHHLLDALQSKQIRENIVCWIIGDGPQRKALEDLATKYNFTDRITFFGNKDRNEAIGLLKASDIVINPSYTEGLPTSLIEAALCRKAIIATRVGGTSEIIKDGTSGILIPSHDTDALRLSLEKLIASKELRESYGDAAYIKCSTMFSWDTAIGLYESLFETVIAK
ncbi:MAG: hypothetical protein A3E36_02140 [Candidatus Andersenbacteria bacterium RIFCSPHIGHO2_12_FULL_45_11b]|uniref:Glycosyltransferase subfamily 4-like N-terminal domain-containing protein n=1 Tax=Candidatus Andersenbacteria bacterium RIFCSPHIGHO2_12_FULL_45_11b TaxID=1797282 RepID=A0A1G1XBF9_9BACT|nr:MAG: hypothetical protein A3E36_02140 [Candidatus Andersenbacteria bacterium RIFCSPHIGHO2_12_FULL_45_11b]